MWQLISISELGLLFQTPRKLKLSISPRKKGQENCPKFSEAYKAVSVIIKI